MSQLILPRGGPTSSARPSSKLSTMHDAPQPPWRSDEELEDYKSDPTSFMLDRCALWKDRIKVFHNWIITATYYLPESIDLGGGIKFYRTTKGLDEALWQGKTGIVIGKGPLAFKDDAHVKFLGQDIEIGQWVLVDPLDARQFTVDNIHCRRMKDTQVIGVVDDPTLVY